MSDERLVMSLLEEGNPATELGDDAWTDVPAATYLATLERRSSEMTQVETKKSRQESRRFWTTPWLVAAVAVIVLGVAAVVVNQANQDSIPLEAAAGNPEATEAFKAVEAAYHAFNTGDPAWVEVRLRGSFFESQEEGDAILSEQLATWLEGQVWNPHIEVSGCASQGHGEWPNLVDEGVSTPNGYYFICETSTTDSLYDVAEVRMAETFHWVVDNGVVLAVVSEDDGSETDAFLNAFEVWLRQNHPEVAAVIVDRMEGAPTPSGIDPEGVSTVLEYAEEFVAESDIYPTEPDSS